MEGAVVSEDQMHAALPNGTSLKFRHVAKPSCDGCSLKNRSGGLPCSPGTRTDNKHGVWELDNG